MISLYNGKILRTNNEYFSTEVDAQGFFEHFISNKNQEGKFTQRVSHEFEDEEKVDNSWLCFCRSRKQTLQKISSSSEQSSLGQNSKISREFIERFFRFWCPQKNEEGKLFFQKATLRKVISQASDSTCFTAIFSTNSCAVFLQKEHSISGNLTIDRLEICPRPEIPLSENPTHCSSYFGFPIQLSPTRDGAFPQFKSVFRDKYGNKDVWAVTLCSSENRSAFEKIDVGHTKIVVEGMVRLNSYFRMTSQLCRSSNNKNYYTVKISDSFSLEDIKSISRTTWLRPRWAVKKMIDHIYKQHHTIVDYRLYENNCADWAIREVKICHISIDKTNAKFVIWTSPKKLSPTEMKEEDKKGDPHSCIDVLKTSDDFLSLASILDSDPFSAESMLKQFLLTKALKLTDDETKKAKININLFDLERHVRFTQDNCVKKWNNFLQLKQETCSKKPIYPFTQFFRGVLRFETNPFSIQAQQDLRESRKNSKAIINKLNTSAKIPINLQKKSKYEELVKSINQYLHHSEYTTVANSQSFYGMSSDRLKFPGYRINAEYEVYIRDKQGKYELSEGQFASFLEIMKKKNEFSLNIKDKEKKIAAYKAKANSIKSKIIEKSKEKINCVSLETRVNAYHDISLFLSSSECFVTSHAQGFFSSRNRDELLDIAFSILKKNRLKNHERMLNLIRIQKGKEGDPFCTDPDEPQAILLRAKLLVDALSNDFTNVEGHYELYRFLKRNTSVNITDLFGNSLNEIIEKYEKSMEQKFASSNTPLIDWLTEAASKDVKYFAKINNDDLQSYYLGLLEENIEVKRSHFETFLKNTGTKENFYVYNALLELAEIESLEIDQIENRNVKMATPYYKFAVLLGDQQTLHLPEGQLKKEDFLYEAIRHITPPRDDDESTLLNRCYSHLSKESTKVFKTLFSDDVNPTSSGQASSSYSRYSSAGEEKKG